MLVFFIIIISFLLFINILAIALCFSKIKIEINTLNLKISGSDDFKIKVSLVLGNLKLFKIIINKENLPNSKLLKNVKLKDFNKNNKDFFEIINIIKIEYLNLKAEIGLVNIIALSYVTTILNILISIVLAKKGNINNIDNYKYKIIPCNNKEILFNLSINCIFSIDFVNIINIFLKKRGKSYGRTPNRVFNGNCYE